MVDFLISADAALFTFINGTLSNPVSDAVMPWLTDWNKSPVGLGLAIVFLALLNWKGGKKGRILTLLLLLLIVSTDQISSNLLKSIFARPRPCHEVNGVRVISGIRLLVDCGSGYSFPSSHAVNNFACATLFAYYYRRFAPLFFIYAFLMGLSRIVVGVHFPSDVVGGAIIGSGIALAFIAAWNALCGHFPFLAISPGTSEPAKLS